MPYTADPDGPGPSSGMRERGNRKTTSPDRPPDKAQRNFSDPDSRIIPSGGGFNADYNAQIAVDAAHQIIVAQCLTTNPADFADPTAGRVLRHKPRMHAMAETIRKAGRRNRYRLRKQVVEPVFGQIKQARGFRQVLLRGLAKVRGEWAMVCTAHNLLKLHKATP